MPDDSLAETGVTTSSLEANDDLPNDNRDDDGSLDAEALDEDSYGEELDEDTVSDGDIVIEPDNNATFPEGSDDADDDADDEDADADDRTTR